MSEDSLGLDAKFEGVDRRFDGIDRRLDGVDHRLEGVDHRLNGIDGRLDGLDQRLDRVDQRLDTLTTGQDALRQDVQDLGREMRVLHEDTIDKIAALAPDFAPIRREFIEADRMLREDVDRRLVPLEAAVRSIRERRPKKPR